MRFPRYAWHTPSPLADGVGGAAWAGDSTLPPPLVRLLIQRGWADDETLRAFLDPRLSGLSDPFGLADMPPAVERIRAALAAREPILVFADFDADGVTAAALLGGVLERLNARVDVFHPDRIREGYGLSIPALERALSLHPDTRLLITADCGIRSIAEVRAARDRGIDTIVTDHHEPSDTLPDALAVVNPRRRPLQAACADLAGVGVAFKLCHALVKQARAHGCPRAKILDLRHYLDLVALGTVADIVPVTGENRTLIRHGLARLSRSPSPGFSALMRRSGLVPPVQSRDLAFVLGPRINAAGRMDSAALATRLLGCRDGDEAMTLACRLEQLNALRRHQEQTILDGALEQVAARDPAADGAVVVGAEGWHPGAIGIVAARLADTYARPSVVISRTPDGAGRGSVRSAAGINLLGVLDACAPWLAQAGGHPAAAGLRLRPGGFEGFRDAFMQACRERLGPGGAAPPELRIDVWLQIGDLSLALVDGMTRLEPFGAGNPAPCWGLSGILPCGPPIRMGENQKHLRLRISGPGDSTFDAVGFGMGQADIPDGALDLAFTVHRNRWNGQDRLQLRLQDLRPAQPSTA